MQPKISFYLKEPSVKTETLIFTLVYITRSQRYKFSTGIKLHPDLWNPKKHSVRSGHPQSLKLNQLLKKKKTELENICVDAAIENKNITKDYLYTQAKYLHSKSDDGDFFIHYDNFIDSKKNYCEQVTINRFLLIKKHLTNFAASQNFVFTFDSINTDFHLKFIDYLTNNVGMFNTTAEKTVKCLKSFMDYSFEKGLHENLAFKKFKALKGKSEDFIALSIEELERIENLKNLHPTLEKCRDLFLLQCYTGVRFSDLINIDNNPAKDGFINITTKKTKTVTKIPVFKRLVTLLDKYTKKGIVKLPMVTNPTLNSRLKEIGQLANLNEICTKVRYKGGQAHEFKKAKWELLTTHSGRRTFITLSLVLGMDADSIKKISGHKNDRSFKKYILYSDDQLKEKIKVWD